MKEWNQIHNLTGPKTIDVIYVNIIDSLYPLSIINTPNTLLDVGTAAGFPRLVLTELLKKRVSFLKYAVIDL